MSAVAGLLLSLFFITHVLLPKYKLRLGIALCNHSTLKQELEGLGMGVIWINGEESNRNVCREVSKRCVDIERQNTEASM
jgi:hypothetical protein